ncbi:MAG: DLW-39 family protein [Marmoricola sp.]
MKKLLFVVVAAVAGVFVKKKLDESRDEQALWQQATDPVEKA